MLAGDPIAAQPQAPRATPLRAPFSPAGEGQATGGAAPYLERLPGLTAHLLERHAYRSEGADEQAESFFPRVFEGDAEGGERLGGDPVARPQDPGQRILVAH